MADTLSNGAFFSRLESCRHDREKMIDFYNDTAGGYDKLMAESQYDQTIFYTCNLLKENLCENGCVTSKVKIVDIGCGSGLSGVSLKTAGFQQITGIDPSTGMLEKAKLLDIYTSLKPGKLTGTEKLDLESSSFDGILCCGCISTAHIQLEDAIPEFLRLLKDDGIAVYTVSPTVSQGRLLQEHLNNVLKKTCEVLRMENRFYLYAAGKRVDCTVMVIKKLKDS